MRKDISVNLPYSNTFQEYTVFPREWHFLYRPFVAGINLEYAHDVYLFIAIGVYFNAWLSTQPLWATSCPLLAFSVHQVTYNPFGRLLTHSGV